VSHRVGLRPLRKLLAKIILYIAGNPHLPYTLRIYIIRNRWVVSALYHTRVRDKISFTSLSRVIRELEEAVSAGDAYSTETADLVERSLEESVDTSELVTREVAERVIMQSEESVYSSDVYNFETADRVERSLEESVSAAETYNVEEATRVVRQLKETVSTVDQISRQVAERRVIKLEETVTPYEVGIQGGAPWEEDPDKKVWAYYDFEKALVDEIANFFILNPSLIKTLDATDVEETAATLNGYLYGDSWVERGFEWGTTPGYYTEEWTETGSFGEGAFSHRITGLTPGVTYYFRAKARKG